MRQSILVTLLLGASFTLTGNLALAQSASTQDEGSASAQRITIKQKSSNVKGATDPRSRENGACDRPYVWSTLQRKCVLPIKHQEMGIDAAASTREAAPGNRDRGSGLPTGKRAYPDPLQAPAADGRGRPDASGTAPGGIMGPAGSPVPPMGGIKPPPGSALPSRCPLGSHWVGPLGWSQPAQQQARPLRARQGSD